jgi:hypothetical protein
LKEPSVHEADTIYKGLKMINNEIKLKENARDLSDTESDENLKEFTKGVVQ